MYNYDDYYSYYTSSTGSTGIFQMLSTYMLVISIISLAISVVTIISMWKIFTKAGKEGWKAIIPIYNIIVLLEIVELPVWYIALFFVPIANIYAMFKIYIELAHKFGKTTGFGVAMAFFSFVCMPILAFSNATYNGSNNQMTSNTSSSQPFNNISQQPVEQTNNFQNMNGMQPIQNPMNTQQINNDQNINNMQQTINAQNTSEPQSVSLNSVNSVQPNLQQNVGYQNPVNDQPLGTQQNVNYQNPVNNQSLETQQNVDYQNPVSTQPLETQQNVNYQNPVNTQPLGTQQNLEDTPQSTQV